MAHLLVQNNSINDGQSGAFVDIANPLTEIWCDFELVITGELPSEATVDWHGEWDEAATYPADAYVFHNGYSWRAPVDMSAGDEPGVPAFNSILSHVRGLPVFDYDRIKSATPVVRSYTDEADHTNISGRPGRAIYIDKTGSSGHTVTVKNLHPDQDMGCAFYEEVDQFIGIGMSTILPGDTDSVDLPDTSIDYYGAVYVGSGSDVDSGASFEVSITNGSSLVAPASIKQNWELVGPGTRGPAVPNLFEFYGFRPFGFDRLPAPVPPPEPPPDPEPEPEPDGVVAIDFPAGSFTDGRTWEIHFSLAVGGTFTVVHTCEGEGVFLYYDGNDNSADFTLGLGPFPGLPPGDYTVYVNSPTDTERSCSIQIVLSDGATFADPDGAPILIDTYVPPEWGVSFGNWNYAIEQVQDSSFNQSTFRKNEDDFSDVTKIWFARRNTDDANMEAELDGITTGDQIRLQFPPGVGTELDVVYNVTEDAFAIVGFEEITRIEVTVEVVSITWNDSHNYDEEHELRVIT